MRRARVVALFFVLAAFTPSSTDARSRPIPLPEGDGAWVHAASGASFPAAVAGFRRVRATAFDRSGWDVGVSYRIADRDVAGAVNVFVYPVPADRDADAPPHVEEVEAHVVAAFPGARRVHRAALSVADGDFRLAGWKVVWEVPDSAAGPPVPAMTEILLFEIDGWYWKFRASARLSDRDRFDNAVSRLLLGLGPPSGVPGGHGGANVARTK